MALRGVHRLQDLLVARLDALSDLLNGRSVSQLRGQLRRRLLDLQDALLDVARNVDGPPTVPEVALQLSEDRGDREGGEGGAALRVEPIDRLHEPDAGDLHEVV